jgi:hypothetical protein
MVLCGGAGYLFQPDTYRAAAVMQVNGPVGLGPCVDTAAGVGGELTSPANLNAASAALNAQGISVTPGEIAMRLTVKRIPESQLIHVAFDAPLPANATAGVNAVVSNSASSGVNVVASAGMATRSQRNALYPIGGLAIGLLAGVFIVALRSQ